MNIDYVREELKLILKNFQSLSQTELSGELIKLANEIDDNIAITPEVSDSAGKWSEYIVNKVHQSFPYSGIGASYKRLYPELSMLLKNRVDNLPPIESALALLNAVEIYTGDSLSLAQRHSWDKMKVWEVMNGFGQEESITIGDLVRLADWIRSIEEIDTKVFK